jgi:hypothetical protein
MAVLPPGISRGQGGEGQEGRRKGRGRARAYGRWGPIRDLEAAHLLLLV